MAETYRLPKWGLTMEEGTIVEWVCGPGERVKEGVVIARVETDKIEVDFEAPVSGILAAQLVSPGTTVAVGEPVVVIATDQDDYAAYQAEHPGAG
jgi:pyruvate/2-oxoglutarate dehydrogenase complex dihydrolipoamide acyltransferase (E2) component